MTNKVQKLNELLNEASKESTAQSLAEAKREIKREIQNMVKVMEDISVELISEQLRLFKDSLDRNFIEDAIEKAEDLQQMYNNLSEKEKKKIDQDLGSVDRQQTKLTFSGLVDETKKLK